MKKEEIFKKLLQTVGVTADEADKLITSDSDVEFTIPEGTFFSEDELKTRDEQIGKDRGKAALEIAIKKARNDLGLEFEGKTMENLIKAHKAKIEADAKIEPDKKVQELQKDNDALRSTVADLESQKSEFETKYENKTLMYEFNNKMSSTISKDKLKDGWTPEFVSDVFSKHYEPKRDDNGNMILIERSTGEVVKNDKTREAEKAENVINSFVIKNGMISEDRQGRGAKGGKAGIGATSKHSHIKTKEDYFEYCKAEGLNPNGEKAVSLLVELQKENKDFGRE